MTTSASPRGPSRRKETRVASVARETIRVLLIEDNPRDAAVVRRMLGKYDRAVFQVASVGSTKEGERALNGDSRFDVLLLDYRLPGEDGLSFLRRLNGNANTPPVILLTGQGDERIARESMDCGAYDYLPKDSISSDLLARTIHQSLEKYQLDRQLLNEQLEGSERVILSLAAGAEAKDPTTEGHLRRLALGAVDLGRALGLDERELLLLRYGGLLHDIGKLGVSEAILYKPGPLTEAEWQEMRAHPIIGERICQPLRLSHAVGPIVRHHHERWDGQGYPDSLSGEEIPRLARIISVTDAFDSMCSDRPYRKALQPDEAVQRLSDGAGTQWDPDIMRVFLDTLSAKA